jgi:hypothetical protein
VWEMPGAHKTRIRGLTAVVPGGCCRTTAVLVYTVNEMVLLGCSTYTNSAVRLVAAVVAAKKAGVTAEAITLHELCSCCI